MPKKKKILPDEISNIIKETEERSHQEDIAIAEAEINKLIEQQKQDKNHWDVKIGDPIEYFDPTLSYEVTGYRPIDKTHGLDFDPSWFTEARDYYQSHKKYCEYIPKSKRYNEFWKVQYERCKYGYSSHGYTITGDNYFFLNFYTLPLVDINKASGEGTTEGFPTFFVSQYTFFHYLQLCRVLHKHACLMKARSIGFSEINASLMARMYSIIRSSRSAVTCFADTQLKLTFSKLDHALTFLNTNTQGGMFKPRIIDKELFKKSGFQRKVNGQFEDAGFKSVVLGINGSDASNIRGDRTDLLIYDEAGMWPGLTKAIMQGQELCEVQGVPRGTIISGGTGGDFGPKLAGLKEIYYNPQNYKVLPYRHNYTESGEYVITGFFIPYYAQSLNPIYMDSRGVCDTDAFKAELQKERDGYLSTPQSYLQKCAERCWNAEEAFDLEGDNKFNKIKIAEQLAEIRLHKRGDTPIAGYIDYIFKGEHNLKNITGYKWIPNPSGKVKILEHPVWSEEYQSKIAKLKKKAEEEGKSFETPVYKEMSDLYVAGIDGIDIGANQTSDTTKDPSDFCMVIKRRVFGLSEPQIVCVYKDRPGNVREAYKIAMCLARYYNCKINIEATRVGMITWARENDCLQYFMKRPRATLVDVRYGSTKQYGTPATKQIIEQQTDLIADFVDDYCHTIWFEEVLDQLKNYSNENKRKFDIIAAMGMVELADQELSGRKPIEVVQDDSEYQDIGYYRDERGIKHYGVIPKKKPLQYTFNLEENDYRGIKTSDPRLYQGYL